MIGEKMRLFMKLAARIRSENVQKIHAMNQAFSLMRFDIRACRRITAWE